MKTTSFLVACVLLSCFLGACHGGDLRKNFYRNSCPQAEAIVKTKIQQHVAARPELPAKLIRMHFHDCFVRFNNVPLWEVLTGRRDGRVSTASEALANLPPPFFNFTQLKQSFESKKLTVHDLVVLSGAHTIGVGHCNLFSNRLFNFTGKGDQDPSLNPTYADFLKTKCQALSDTTTTDYSGEHTDAKNFYTVLSGNRSAITGGTGKVVDSGPNDTIFIYYADHGAPGFVSDLRKNFYRNSCPQAEAIVKTKIQQHVAARPELPAKLIRMHFHDCFVRFNNVPLWEVLTGRRDGRVSTASEALANLPPPFFNFTQLKQSFESKKLTVHDLVVLSGAHTIGVGHCNLFSNRLFNFTGKGDQDPSLNPTYADFLKTKCQALSDTTTTVELDPNGSTKFDNDYYNILVQNKGLFQSDAALLTTKTSRNIVNELRNQNKFYTEFGQSMQRMGAIEVLTGSAGEIRHKCSVVNSN
ncbi:hypothetical protein Ahy_B06g080465 [Arachis hypogaea]|uniref:peroxidase n=1 Tax=Arachis hypogaea TaxID=3818 RepID=A0A444YI82_ARAHY|nr:hypothetical protein Ahy_B06g080465 [Arachis hypogaea]